MQRKHSKAITKRFVYAIVEIAKQKYPDKRESDIAESVGITRTNYTRLKGSKNNYPTLDNCVELCKQYNISSQWLLFGVGAMKNLNGKQYNPVEAIKVALSAIETKFKLKNKVK